MPFIIILHTNFSQTFMGPLFFCPSWSTKKAKIRISPEQHCITNRNREVPIDITSLRDISDCFSYLLDCFPFKTYFPFIFWYEAKNRDRKSTRLNSSHMAISYAVYFL